MPTTVLDRETRRADELKAGDWIAALQIPGDDGWPIEVLSVHPTIDICGPSVLLVYRTLAGRADSTVVDAERQYELVTDAEMREVRTRGERDKFIAGLHEFADWLKANPWAPINDDGRYTHQARIQINLRAADVATVEQVRELAGRLGVKVDESLDDRTDASVEIGSVSYSVIAWHKDGRPIEPEPEREGRWFEGRWFEVGDRVYPFPRGGEVVTVTEVAEIAGSKPSRQQFRANGKTIWRHSDEYQPR